MRLEWTGNPLSKEGTRCRCGSIEAELMRIDPYGVFAIDRSTPQLRRTWLLNILERDDLLIGGDRCLSTVVLVNLMPEVAKREAEQIVRWAVAACDAPETTPPAPGGAGHGREG